MEDRQKRKASINNQQSIVKWATSGAGKQHRTQNEDDADLKSNSRDIIHEQISMQG